MKIFLVSLMFVLGAGCSSGPEIARDPAGANTTLARKLNDEAFGLIAQGKYEQALPILQKSIDADVMFGPARNNMGLVYFHQDKLYAAAWEFQNAIKMMPHVPEPRNNLGLVLERAGKVGEAAEAFAKARSMEPDNPQYIGNLARAKVRRGDDDAETRKLLQELVLKDSRGEWREWARMNLLRMNSRTIGGGVGSGGATTGPVR